jgi:hypothetical protein
LRSRALTLARECTAWEQRHWRRQVGLRVLQQGFRFEKGKKWG